MTNAGRSESLEPSERAALKREIAHLLALMLVKDFEEHGYLAAGATVGSGSGPSRVDVQHDTV
jgi:hypothetical protein